MKFLAIDTSNKGVCVAAYNEGKASVRTRDGVTSVNLMGEIDCALEEVGLTVGDVDFFACVVGPGSFTGIRIGISTVKGLCFACKKPALALTSFELLAYAERGKNLALVDAGHGNYYACPYIDGVAGTASFLSEQEVEDYRGQGYKLLSAVEIGVQTQILAVDKGLVGAALKNSFDLSEGGALAAVYLRKSSAEENLRG